MNIFDQIFVEEDDNTAAIETGTSGNLQDCLREYLAGCVIQDIHIVSMNLLHNGIIDSILNSCLSKEFKDYLSSREGIDTPLRQRGRPKREKASYAIVYKIPKCVHTDIRSLVSTIPHLSKRQALECMLLRIIELGLQDVQLPEPDFEDDLILNADHIDLEIWSSFQNYLNNIGWNPSIQRIGEASMMLLWDAITIDEQKTRNMLIEYAEKKKK